MAVPKFRTSKSKKRSRHAGNKSVVHTTSMECPHCHEYKLPHRVCPHCGYYNGEQILEVEEEE